MTRLLPLLLAVAIILGLAVNLTNANSITALQAPLKNAQFNVPEIIKETPGYLDDTVWTAIAAPTTTPDRLAHATVYDPVNDKIYIIGGNPDGYLTSNVRLCQQYDPESNTWTDKAQMPTAKAWICGAYVRGKIYVIGGIDVNGGALTENAEYDITNNTWTTKAPRPRAAGASLDVVWRDSLIYVMGGWDAVSTGGWTNVDIYDPFTNTWSSGTPLPQNADMGGAAIIGDTIYIVDAVNRSGSACWLNLYKGAINPANPTQITWIQGPAFSTPTSICGAAAVTGNVFWLGGFANLSSVTNQAWVYDRTTGTIRSFVNFPVAVARCWFMTARTENTYELYVMAGDQGGNWSPPNQTYMKCVLGVPRDHDVGVRSITSPTGRIPSGNPINVEAVIKNFGTNDETFPATALILTQTDDTVFAKETTLTLTARTEESVVFGEFTPDPDMYYDVIFYTALVGDENPANDTLTGEARTTPDAGVLHIIAPTGRIIPGTTVNATAVVKNFSAEPKDVPATMTIVDTVTGNTILDVDTTLAMGAGESLSVMFGQFTATIGSFYDVIAYTSLVGDDDPSNDTAYATAVCRYGSAPDPFGYYYESTQEPGDTVTFSWIDPTGGTVLSGWSPSADDGYVTRTLPFGFKFYSPASSPPNITQINVCTNGFLQWPTTTTTWTNTALPNNTIQNFIGPFWDDLNPGAGGQVIEKTGTDGQYVAYTWVNVPRYGTSEYQTFQVVLYRDNKIRFNYLDVNGTLNSNTVGIQGGTGANGWYQQYVFDGNPANHIVADNVTIAFTCDSMRGIAEVTKNTLPTTTTLHPVRPNPVAKGDAQISFTLANKGNVTINIYDATGRLVRNLTHAPYDAGNYTLTWDGRDDKGTEVIAGIYFYTIKTDDYKATKKLVLMR